MIAGVHKAMANKVAAMGKRVGFKGKIVFTGGVAKNAGIKNALEDATGMLVSTHEESQIAGALGAAILAAALPPPGQGR